MMNAHGETSFGAQVRQQREALGLTRKELAQRVSCSIEMIRKIESSERYPSVQIAKLLAEHLALDIDDSFPRRRPTQSSALIEPEFPLIGRTKEWETLRAAWRKALKGNAHLVCIAGDAGIGKTRLAEELLVHAQHQGHSVARTRAYALEGRLAYAPVAAWLRSTALATQVSALPTVWRSEIARLLPELLIEDPTLPPPQPLIERWQLKRLFEALLQAFSAAEKHNPILLVLDDLQWCDPETLEWLQYLLSAAPHHRLLVAATVRDTEVDAAHPLHTLWRALLGEGQLTQLPLLPLSQNETVRLGAAVAQQPLDAPDADRLFSDSAGNPLFVIESIRYQYSHHSQPHVAAAPTAQHNGLASLPPKVYVTLQGRLERLSPAARAIAEVAAVAGRAFTLPLLAQAGRWDDMQTALGLGELLQRRLVREHGGAQFDFSHDRIRDVTYAEISPVKRNVLHRALAQALERVHADHLDTVAGELAGHYQQSGDLERALAYFRQAAAVAERLFAHQEVVRYLERAIVVAQMRPDNLEHRAANLELLNSLGNAYTWIYGYGSPQQGEVWAKAYTLAQQVGTVFQRAEATIQFGSFASFQGDMHTGLDRARQALPLANDSGDLHMMVLANSQYGRALYHLGDLEKAHMYLRQAKTLVEELAKTPNGVQQIRRHTNILIRLAQCLWLLGFPDQAVNLAHTTLREIHASVDVSINFALLNFIAQMYSFVRNFVMVQRLSETLINISTKYEFPFFGFVGQAYFGWAIAHLGDAQSGLAMVRDGVKGERESGSNLFATYNRGALAEVLALVNEHEEAIDEVNIALDLAGKTGNVFWNAHLLKLKGDLLHALGTPDSETEAWYQRALALARAQSARSLELRAATSLARLWQQQGNVTQAQQLLAPIYGWFSEGFDTPDLQEAKALLEEVELAAYSLGSSPTLSHNAR